MQKADIRSQLQAFFKEHFTTDRMTLVLYGRESTDMLLEYAQLFNGICDGPSKLPPSMVPPAPLDTSLLRYQSVDDAYSLIFTWIVPMNLAQLFRSKPAVYVSHVLGHEAAGSLAAFLREKGLGSSVSAGVQEEYERFFVFTIDIELTPKGHEEVDTVIASTFDAIRIQEKVGAMSWVWKELRDAGRLGWQFFEKGEPMGTVARLAGSLQKFPPLAVLSNAYDFDFPNGTAVQGILSFLSRQHCLIAHGSKHWTGLTSTEKWYGTRFNITHYNVPALSPSIRDGLHIPNPNPFLASGVSASSVVKAAGLSALPAPVRLQESAARVPVVWHSSVSRFPRPRGFVRLLVTNGR